MKKLLFLLIPIIGFCQLQIGKPDGWFLQGKNETVIKNLKYVYSENKSLANELVQDINERGTVLYVYTKYDLRTHQGLSPTINVTLISNNKLDLEGLKRHTKEEFTKDLKRATKNFSFKYLRDIKIGNNNAFVMHTTFNLPNYNEDIRSWVYMYPIKNDLFYQINFSDIYTDKCDELFSQIINDIK